MHGRSTAGQRHGPGQSDDSVPASDRPESAGNPRSVASPPTGLPIHHPELVGLLGIPTDHHEAEYCAPRTEMIGTRAWLYGYRQRAAEERRPVDAIRWFADRPVTTITADSSDSELIQAADREQEAATVEGVKLLGTVELLRTRRAEMREQVRAELPPVATRVKADEDALKDSRTARHELLTRVMSWQDPQDSNDAALGRLAGMSRQAVNQLRETFAEPE